MKSINKFASTMNIISSGVEVVKAVSEFRAAKVSRIKSQQSFDARIKASNDSLDDYIKKSQIDMARNKELHDVRVAQQQREHEEHMNEHNALVTKYTVDMSKIDKLIEQLSDSDVDHDSIFEEITKIKFGK